MQKLLTLGQRIVDEEGGEVILHGFNLVCKDKSVGYLPACGEKEFQWMKKQGMNVLRLGVIWDGVEPESGKFDREYLRKLRAIAETAEKFGLYVFLDMHQDLFSVQFSDGAPEWATLTDGLPHIPGEVWSDAYLQSPAVIRACDHFWQNSPGPDGVGLQDHCAAAWKTIMEEFEGCSNLIGCDFWNEPFPGSMGQQVLAAMLEGWTGEPCDSPEKFEKLWESVSDRETLLKVLSDIPTFCQVTEAAKSVNSAFESEYLNKFIQKVYQNLPQSAKKNLIMLESSYFSNMAVESGVQKIDAPFQVYAPHGYDLVVDTDCQEYYSQERTRLIFDAHRRVQQRLNVPVLIGEWGAFGCYQDPAYTEMGAMGISRIFEEYGWSDTYWCWEAFMLESPLARGILRGYPQRIGGKLLSYQYDWETGRFIMRYESDGSPCRIYLPGKGFVEICRPAGDAEIILEN